MLSAALYIFIIVKSVNFIGVISVLESAVEPDVILATRVISGLKASLPCDLTMNQDDDKVLLVLWYKMGDDGGFPIYTVDARGRSLTQANHRTPSDTIKGRGNFEPFKNNPVLSINSVLQTDSGSYICRVDFKKTPTRYTKINLTVIVPPSPPLITDLNGNEIISSVGPYTVGQTLSLLCSSTGDPLPEVTWWRDGELVDSSFEIVNKEKMQNMLKIPDLRRSDFNSEISCKASNSNLTKPAVSSVTIDMSLSPLTAEIINPSSYLSTKNSSEVVCRSTGSRPPATITWRLKGEVQTETRQTTSPNGNITESRFLFTPKAKHNGQILTCTARNKVGGTEEKTATWELTVHYLPEVVVKMGKSLNPDNIQVGDDVYFECSVVANPVIFRTSWSLDDKPLRHGVLDGIIISNQTLVLQKVTRDSAGVYRCHAFNEEGEGKSTGINLKVKYTPKCKPSQRRTYGISLNEEAFITCELEAEPPDINFRWDINRTNEIISLPIESYTKEGLNSTLKYIPKAERDYGTLLCRGENSVGFQTEPCVFYVLQAGPPEPLLNCTVWNLTFNSFHVECEKGYDGGLPQVFTGEFYEASTQNLLFNSTLRTPIFVLQNLTPNSEINAQIYAVNIKGRSAAYRLPIHTLKVAEKRARGTLDVITKKTNFPLVPVILGSCAGLILVSLMFIISICVYYQKRRQKTVKIVEITAGKSIAIAQTSLDTDPDNDERNPDVIPQGSDTTESSLPSRCLASFYTLPTRSMDVLGIQETMYPTQWLNTISGSKRSNGSMIYGDMGMPKDPFSTLAPTRHRSETVYAQINHGQTWTFPRKIKPRDIPRQEPEVPVIACSYLEHQESAV